MATVQKLLDSELPRPTWAFRPSLSAPIRSDMTFSRPDVDNPDPTARTLDPRSGLYEGRSVDTPRIHGSQQSLLVEAASRTNHVAYSSDISQWAPNGVTLNNKTSLIDGETAQEVVSGGSVINDVTQTTAGTFPSGSQVVYIIAEKVTATRIAVDLRNETSGTAYRVCYNFDTDDLTEENGTIDSKNVRTLSTNGPNGGKVVLVQFRISSGSSGDDRGVKIFPDKDGNSDSTIVHHAQIEEAPNASSPIVTGSSATTRGADDAEILVGDWFNSNGGTFFFELSRRAYYLGGNSAVFMEGSSTDDPYLYDTGGQYRVFATNFELVTSFGKDKVAFGSNGSTSHAAANGTAITGGSSTFPNESTGFSLSQGSIIHLFYRIVYFPELLPATEADRSAGDPISLETLTS